MLALAGLCVVAALIAAVVVTDERGATPRVASPASDDAAPRMSQIV
jgi:hypothetical protein